MTVVRVGATKQYSENWDSIFSRGGKKMSKPAPVVAKAKSKGKKKAAKKR